MTTEVRIKKLEIKAQREAAALTLINQMAVAGKDVAVEALRNPGISAVLMVALAEYMTKKGLINETERTVLVSSGLLLELVKSVDLGSLLKAGLLKGA